MRLVVGIAAGCIAIVMAALVVLYRAQHVHAGERTPVLVELYTSEGCSSCPPADMLLRDLLKEQPVAGAHIVPLAFHVDYWDYLGWRDPFGAPEYGTRQREYAAAFENATIYTPQMIVDGRIEFVGSRAREAVSAVAEASGRDKIALDVSIAERLEDGVAFSVRLDVARLPDSVATPMVYAMITEDGLEQAVPRGENAGRTLQHDGVVRIARRLTLEGNQASARLDIGAEWNPDALRLVVFAEDMGGEGVLALAVQDLPAQQ